MSMGSSMTGTAVGHLAALLVAITWRIIMGKMSKQSWHHASRKRNRQQQSENCSLGKPKPATTAPGHDATVIVKDRSATDGHADVQRADRCSPHKDWHCRSAIFGGNTATLNEEIKLKLASVTFSLKTTPILSAISHFLLDFYLYNVSCLVMETNNMGKN